jgi:hypothetical protein
MTAENTSSEPGSEFWHGTGQHPRNGRRDSQRREPCSCYTPGSASPLTARPVPHRSAAQCLAVHHQVAAGSAGPLGKEGLAKAGKVPVNARSRRGERA